MKRSLALFLLLLLAAAPAAAQAPGIDVLHYTFRLDLSDDSDEIAGEASVAVRFLRDGAAAFTLDLVGKAAPGAARGMAVIAVAEGEAPVPFTHARNRLEIRLPTPARTGERRTYTVRYRGTPADGLIISKNKHGQRTFFGDNWPDRARHWLPSVDHPSDKATVEWIVTAPGQYRVVGSGALVEETDLDGGRRLTRWRTTAPLATKVMVIGAARFAVQHVGVYAGTPIQSWVYPQDRVAGFYDFARAERILAFFAARIGPYPYEKLANVQSTTRYGGMENAGNIFYGENRITGDRSNEGLLAHEIAHQWFGDSVTEAAWPHVWLSEGFATYFTQLYFEFTYGRDRLNAGMQAHRADVLAYYRRRPAPLVDTTVTTLTDLLNANTYEKGGWVLHMLRFVVGDEAFWDGIAAYYRQYRDGNALTEDFQRAMEEAAGRDLSWFFRQWVYQPGQPRYEGGWRYDAATRRLTVTLNQAQRDGRFFRMPVELGIYAAAGAPPRLEVLQVDEVENTFTFTLDAPPAAVVLDPNGWMLMEADFRAR